MPLPRYQHNSSQILNTICYSKELSGLYIIPFFDDQVAKTFKHSKPADSIR